MFIENFFAPRWKAKFHAVNLIIIFGYNVLIRSPGLILDFELKISNLIILIQFSISTFLQWSHLLLAFSLYRSKFSSSTKVIKVGNIEVNTL